jgi:squalene-associated FAD-dependent desaturase
MAQGVHIVGAGLAGLAAAVRCSELGLRVRLSEAAPQAGGRCRSFEDATLGRVIDNGSHLILGGNTAIFAHLDSIGARDRLEPLDAARFPFLDLASGRRWTVRPGSARLPLWLLMPSRRVPGARVSDYWAMRRLIDAPRAARLVDYIDGASPMFERFWRPLSVAVLNTEPEEASARLIGRVLAETVLAGGRASLPYFARVSLSDALIAPALRLLDRAGAEVHFARRLRAFEMHGERVVRLRFVEDSSEVGAKEAVILAAPSWEAAELVPGLATPGATRPIVNGHFRVDARFTLAGNAPFLGLVGGLAQWLFRRGDVISATVSAADELVDEPAERIAELLWRDIKQAIGRVDLVQPPVRIIKERRATIAQTPEQDALRPGAVTRWRNLLLAGDWTDTGLPATIEGAVRSGRNAAELAAAGDS